MKLTYKGLSDPAYGEKGYSLPRFDVREMARKTKLTPRWLHFGAGNLFRAFPAAVLQTLLDSGSCEEGVIVAESYDGEILDKIYTPHDNLSLLVTLKADGGTEKTVVASVAEAVRADSALPAEWARLKEIFRGASLQMVSFTITEKGYSTEGEVFLRGMENGPEKPVGLMAQTTSLLLERFLAGGAPIALVSMDNCSHNGDKLKAAVMAVAAAWTEKNSAPDGFIDWLNDGARVSFPWSMIDKITPRPDKRVSDALLADGFEAVTAIETEKHTYIAPFVNAEETEYLIIEDHFPGGRPPLEKGGIIFTDRETVEKAEKMKVCSCLNPLHTALAIFGCLLGHVSICKEMADEDLKALVARLGWEECLPVVADPVILKPAEFLRQVLETRFPNPFMPDTPQRIATDTSQKIPIRFGETIKAYQKKGETGRLRFVPLVLAGWLRYLTGVDDKGGKFTPSPDPMLEYLREFTGRLSLGAPDFDKEELIPLLRDSSIFGVDLVEAGLDDKVTGYLRQMLGEAGAVRQTIQNALAQAPPR